MAEFVLKRQKAKTFKVVIDDEKYEIPLSGSLKTKEIKSLDTVEGTIKFMKKYIDAKVVDDLTQAEYNELIKAWGDASKEEAGLSVGE